MDKTRILVLLAKTGEVLKDCDTYRLFACWIIANMPLSIVDAEYRRESKTQFVYVKLDRKG